MIYTSCRLLGSSRSAYSFILDFLQISSLFFYIYLVLKSMYMGMFKPKGSLLSSEIKVYSFSDSNNRITLVPTMSLLATPAGDENCRSTSLESALITASVRSNSLESRPHFHRADLAYCWLTRSVTSSRPTHSLCWSTLHTNCTAAGSRSHPSIRRMGRSTYLS